MVDFTKPVQTRDGRKVRIFATDTHNSVYPVVGVATNIHGEEFPESWTREGRYSVEYCVEREHHPSDLVNVSEKRTGWLNVYEISGFNSFHPTKERADLCASAGRLDCVEVTY